MPFNFSTSQKNTLTSLFNDAKAGRIPYGNVYDYMANVGDGQAGVDTESIKWLRGAAQVNRGEGAASVFIRAYTAEQKNIRSGSAPTASELQSASNKIAENVIADALSTGINGIPPLSRIAERDANEAATKFFGGDKAGWSGNLLFLVLGYDAAFQQNLIYDEPGNTYDVLAMYKAAKVAASQISASEASGIFFSNITWNSFVQSGLNFALADAFLKSIYNTNYTGTLWDGIFANPRNIILGKTDNNNDNLTTLTPDADYVHAEGGDDTIIGSAGADIIDGGNGKDKLDYSSVASDGLYLQLFDKRVTDNQSPITIVNIEHVVGTAGNDRIIGSDIDNTIDGGKGNDWLEGGKGADILVTSIGRDVVDDTGEDDQIKYGDVFLAGEVDKDGVLASTGFRVETGAASPDGAELLIFNGANPASSNTMILVTNFVDGDYGITFATEDPTDPASNDPTANPKSKLPNGNYKTANSIGQMSLGVQVLTPIALDLNGSGRIETLSATTASNKAFFDMDNDNFKEKVGWLNPVDGWLAMDRNGDGQITNQRELFGDSDGKLAYQKLAELNSNNAGASLNRIDAADSAWGNLRVWVDANINGVSEAGELRTLASLGITSLSLESRTGSKQGSFVMNGATRLSQDILVSVNQENSWYMGSASEIKPEALLLPKSRGYGDVKSMHFAASENATLMTQLREIGNLPISSLDSYYAKLQTMVYQWTGASGVATNPIYGTYLDTQHLFATEKLAGIGTGFYAQQLGDNWVLRALSFRWDEGLAREKAYELMISEMAVRFAAQGALKAVFGNPTYDFSTDKMVFSIPLTQILSNARASAPTDIADRNVYWSEIDRTLTLYAGDLGSSATTIKIQIDQAAGYDVTINNIGGRYFEGDTGNNTLNGNTLTNYLIGGNGADTLIGGRADDYLNGGTGADTYRYANGDGNDYIFDIMSGFDFTSVDVLQFTNLNRSVLTFSRVDSNGLIPSTGNGMTSLKIDVAGGGSVLLRDHFVNDANTATNANNRIEQIRFADGTSMDFASTKQATFRPTSGNDTISGFSDAETINGLDGNDNIKGFGGNDTINGGAGNDTINGDDGNDVINGGASKDLLLGGAGNDVFVFSNITDNQATTADFIRGFVSATDKIDLRGLGFRSLDTDGGATEASELRFSTNGGVTTITSDQNGFTFQTDASTISNADFIWL